MLNTIKKLLNLILICGQSLFRREKVITNTSTWGLVYVDTYPFISTVFRYKDDTVKIRLVYRINRQMYVYTFSSRYCIIDDHMIYLQSQRHTREELEQKGYIYATY